MRPNDIEEAAAAVVFFALAVLSAVRGRREPLALRLAVLCALLFAYVTLDLAPSERGWDWLTDATASLATPAFFDFTLSFLGLRQERASWVRASYAYFGALAVACLSPIVAPRMASFPGGPAWAAWMLAGLVPVALVGGWLMLRHARRAGPKERGRAALVFGAILVAALGSTDDLVSIAGARTPRVSAATLALSALLLAGAAFRIEVLERVSVLVGLNVAVLGVLVVLGEVALQGAGSLPVLLVGSVVLAVGTLLASRFLFGALAEHRERAHADAVLGRMSRQMAHDLRNPLAAIRGAAQFLENEHVLGRPVGGEMLRLLVDQSDRMERVIEQYQRLGRVEPELGALDVNALVERAVRAIDRPVQQRLAPDLPPCEADPELMTIALENVLRNAREAIGEAGTIEVTTSRAGNGVTIVVADDGSGMDARTRERAFDDFFTTKAAGSGLGLSFVRRVIHAHGGRIALDSGEGQGTRVVIDLPVASAA